jgi:hypothetical protein
VVKRHRARARRALGLGAALLCAATWTACSALIDRDTTQCASDGDCARFSAVCDLSQHVCVATPAGSGGGGAPTSSSRASSSGAHAGGGGASSSASIGGGGAAGAGGSCAGGGGCYACTPTNTQELLNACTDATCVPFDNSRCTHLSADGGLPPLQ